ncbi:hypothetical protein [Staphylococcus caeli]|uniref:hypothetical protein n=1 Tax=Staphylococcus caeli TaxID=2201815 RepID=UPI003F544065
MDAKMIGASYRGASHRGAGLSNTSRSESLAEYEKAVAKSIENTNRIKKLKVLILLKSMKKIFIGI